MFKDKKGIGLPPIIISLLVIGVTLIPISKWILSLQDNLSYANDTLDKQTLAYSQYQDILQLGYNNAIKKENSSSSKDVNNYTVTTKYDEKKKIDGTNRFYLPVTITVAETKNLSNSFSFDAKVISSHDENSYSKDEIIQNLKPFVRNITYDYKTKTGGVSMARGQTINQIYAFLDGKNVPLYSDIDMLGKPDWENAKTITFPFKATEDGYLWMNSTQTVSYGYHIITVVASNGAHLEHLSCYDWGGPDVVPLVKGDSVYVTSNPGKLVWAKYAPYKKQ